MFTIHRSDGNLFLARQPRQSGSIRKNASGRGIHATVCLQSGGIGGIGRGICATLQEMRERSIAPAARRAIPGKHQHAGWSRSVDDTATRCEILTLVQRSVTRTVWRIGELLEATGPLRCCYRSLLSSSDSRVALPPAAVVSTDSVRSVAKRCRYRGPPALGPVPLSRSPPKGWAPTTAPIIVRLT